YSTTGRTLLGDVPAYQLFGIPADSFLSDPRAYYDFQTGHWFLSMFTVGTVSDGTLTSPSTQYLAVSQTANPFGPYTTFSWDMTDASNSAGGCPCFGDYDQFGSNRYGIYISTNEFDIAGPDFNGTIIYALSKTGLITAAQGNGPAPTLETVRVPYGSDPYAAYHLAPSEVPQGQSEPATEYFVESNANTNYGDGLEVFALLGTASLSNSSPSLAMSMTTVPTEAYSTPPNALQKSGPLPLGSSLGYGLRSLETDFDAVQEVTFAKGHLYAELNSGFAYGTGTNSGADWFVLAPSTSGGGVSANLTKDGSVDTSQFILYPDIVVNSAGVGYMDFAVSGPTKYPSAAYVAFDGTSGATGPVHIAASGVNPLDDFTCYPPYGPACRYGDYSGGQYYNGRIYMATEYVAPQPRDTASNWATRLWGAPLP
ncbi:MAG: hypothetical protein ACRDZP_04730, partial [Acidimicrobiales bacterium]